MNWQEPAALALVAIAAAMLVRMQVRAYRRRQSRACGSDCACAAGDEGQTGAGRPRAPEIITKP